MHRRVRAARAAENLVGAVGEHLVTVHVVAGARAGLIHIDDELIAVLAAEHLVRRLHDRVGEPAFEPSGLLVGQRGGALDPDHGIDERGQRPESRDRKVLHGAQRLDAVERGSRNRLLAERIALDPGGGGHRRE